MSAARKKTLVVRNGILIDGSGRPAARNDAIVIEGNRIRSVGALPPDVELEDRRTVEVIDAGGQWIMPGLIDAHCHVSYGYPMIKGEGKGKGTTRPEFSTLKSARSVQKVLRSGVTGISVPGGTWFTDVGVRDAIKLGLMEGPRMYVAGRMIVTMAASRTMSRHGKERPITPSASSATPRMRWSRRFGGKENTASTSSRWQTAAPASRRCWRKTRSRPWWARRIGATCASAFILVAPAPPAPPPRPASIGSFMPISP